jgi:energy-coupling factor transport system ATP-binding protein
MLVLENVSYRYAGAARPSLLEANLTLHDGEIVGVVGPSEAGKSTLCLVAAGLAPRTVGGTLTGQVVLDGADSRPLAMHEMAGRVGIGFQNPGTQLSGVTSTVFEEVAFGPMNLGVAREEVVTRTAGALAALRIEELAERDPARLSGGQQQLVAIAGLLALAPTHLVLDEPTAQLDPAGTRLVSEAVKTLAASGRSILITEHKTDLLAAVCDRVLALDAGRIVVEGPVGEVLADSRMRELGIAEPSAVRLRRLALEARVDVASLEGALAAEPP